MTGEPKSTLSLSERVMTGEPKSTLSLSERVMMGDPIRTLSDDLLIDDLRLVDVLTIYIGMYVFYFCVEFAD